MLAKTFITASTLLTLASAHFNLNYPPSVGFDEDKEPDYPCGGYDVTSRKTVTNFNSDTPIALAIGHDSVTWVIRGALLSNTSNWVSLQQNLQTEGVGRYCSLSASVPADFVGQDGVVQVVGNGGDGILYQCAAVKFTAGTFSGSNPSGCTNTSTGAYTSASIALPDSGAFSNDTSANTTTPTTTSSGTPSPTANTTAQTTTPNAGPRNVAGMGVAACAVVGAVGALFL